MKFIFAGTTEFGIPSVEKLMQAGYELAFCITNPDKPAGRKQIPSPTPVKKWCDARGIKVLTPQKTIDAINEIKAAGADFMLVAAYGQIIPKEVLDAPKFGSINIHPSMLPKYRGASPIQTAILNGDQTTAVTLIQMDEKMDHGPIIAAEEYNLLGKKFLDAYREMSELAAELCATAIPLYLAGELKPQEQDHSHSTYTQKFHKADARIDWTNSAEKIYNQIRALNPEPGTWTKLEDRVIKILDAEPLNSTSIELPGKLLRFSSGLAVKTSTGNLLIKKIQPEGKNPMSGIEFLNGQKDLERKHFV